MNTTVSTYEGKPCTVSEMTIGNTVFTVISVQSDAAKEKACDKVKKLILGNLDFTTDSCQCQHS